MTEKSTKTIEETNLNVGNEELRCLVLINDEVHSFDYVIDSLMEVCEHTFEQAAQCTLITHYKGRCDVKKGALEQLRSMRKNLVNKELKAIIC